MSEDTWNFLARVADLAPLFIARPGGGEFIRPTAWQTTPRRGVVKALEDWQPGFAICTVTGDRLAVVDVDPRNGGDVQAVRGMIDRLGVTVFAQVETPGGGRHFYTAGHRDLRSTSKLSGYPGVDVQSHGRNVFLPGTRRPKYDGRGYGVITDDLGALADSGDPDNAEQLAAWVESHSSPGHVHAEASTHVDVGRAVDGAPYRSDNPARLLGVLRHLNAARGGERNTTLFWAACRVGDMLARGELSNPCQAAEALADVARRIGLGPDEISGTIRSGLGRSGPDT